MNFKDYQIRFADWTRNASKENRIGFMKMLLSNLNHQRIKDVQNICARMINRKRYSKDPTMDVITGDEDGWWELEDAERIINWAGYTTSTVLVGYIKLVLPYFRQKEVQEIRSTWTCRAKIQILHPRRLVSRQKSVPSQEGWWSDYGDQIVSLDCEMIPIKIGVKPNGKVRCKNSAATASIISKEGNVIYKVTVKHSPDNIHLTPIAKKITGFTDSSFINGVELLTVQKQLTELLRGKFIILVNAGSDFNALEMNKGDFDVFDLHEHYINDNGKIGLRSLVLHYYNIDIHSGVHDPDVDAKYTMKIFLEHYIPDKLLHPDEKFSRNTNRKFNYIKTVK